MDPLFEGIRVVLSYRGEAYSPAYIQGISGAAFRIAGICPCAPTCSFAMEPQELVELLGYKVEHLPLHGEDIAPKMRVHEVLARLRDEIHAGRPALLWHAFTTCEWDVVCGFDDGQQQLTGCGSTAGREEYATADEARTITCTDICPALGAILIGEKTSEFKAHEAELAALKEAVRHAHSRQNEKLLGGDQWVMLEGLLCYDRWIHDFQADPPKVPDMGDRYCLGVYRSTHRAASEFMRELVPRYPEARPHFELASEHFSNEANALHGCAELLFPDWKLPEGPHGGRNARAVALLSAARDRYARGIDETALALRLIDV